MIVNKYFTKISKKSINLFLGITLITLLVTHVSLAASYFIDDFDDGIYTDRVTVINNDGTTSESGGELHIQIPRPASGCDSATLAINTTFSGQNITVETKVKLTGKGGVYLRLKRDHSNYVEFGFNTDDVPYADFASRENGVVERQWIESSAPYFGTYTVIKIVKTVDQYEVYINGDMKGTTCTNTGIGDSNLIVELNNHTCSHKSGDSDNYFDYVTVSVVPREYYAVIAGIADYPGWINDLNYPDDDVIDMRNALTNYTNWQQANIQLLLDSDATIANIQNAINNIGSQAGSDDVCLFYFSGHGTNGIDLAPFDEIDNRDEYLCAYDGDIRDDQLSTWLAALPTTNVVVIIDSCFSGGQIKDSIKQLAAVKCLSGTQPGVLDGDGFAADFKRKWSKDIDDNPGCVVTTACDDNQLSIELPLINNGLFTYFLVNAINNFFDADTNGELSAEEVATGTIWSFWLLYSQYPMLYSLLNQTPQYYDDYPAGAPQTDSLPLCLPD